MKLSQMIKAAASGLLLVGAAQLSAGEFNQGQAREFCEAKVSESQADQSDFAFRRKAVTNYRRGVYTFMFNYTAKAEGETVSRKVKCEVTKAGELQALDVQNGRWSF
ncbi:hypothetical protein QWY82_05465 [Simiduia curdlanivorans]|uniref:Uncharacterized protein n=1 Tax=Simiduia curdlanivorans TaxID=1492769 RepID=A0ABV8V3V3_9GAMM|nr:hypothetical protein [Simiduia curdlanivorans]MDN3638259.1 hypothetical protein [Simiduia curdlanivorans]